MTRVRKTGLSFLALLCALMLGFGLASCGSKDETPTYGYGEEGLYYYSASETEDYMLTLREGSFVLSMGTGYAGTYECVDGTVTFYEEGEETGSGYATETGFGLTWEGRSYIFFRYEYYTVTFTDGSSTITTQSVLNGKAAMNPGEPDKDGYVFLGWYADSDFTTRYEFNTSITGNTTIYARFVEASSGAAEYIITYDYTSETTETINGVVYNLPEPEQAGYTFLGWWVSATNNASELTYKYSGETLCEDTTLFAFWVADGASYIGASVKEGTLTWLSSPAGTLDIYVEDEEGNITYYSASSTSASQPLSAVSGTGKYKVTVTSGGVTETLTYVSNGLARASGFTVISGSILMYGEVPGAERYYISIDCGTEGHDHSYIDNGTSLYYDFSSCEMPAKGITFTVYAYADGYYYSVSSYNYFLGLDKTEVTVEGSLVSWTPVSYAMGYEVYIDGTLVAITSDTSWSLSRYGTGTYEIAVRPVTTGYYSEKSEAITFTKTTLASPQISGIADYTISWTPVEGATGYTVSINGTETTVGGGDITSLILSDENYTEGLDSYEISVKALAPDSANDSPYGETITVTGTSVGSAVSYENGTVTWQYSLSASEYRITVNDGDEISVTGTNSTAITLTKSGNNEITIYFVNDYDEIYGQASVTIYAYAIVFDARGGTAYDADGNEIDVMYVAKGDTLDLPGAEYTAGQADFMGWYTLPDIVIDPDKEAYEGDGVLFEDGTVFTGNSTIVLYAFWVNQRLSVRLDAGQGTAYDADGNAVDSTLIPINGENYVVPVPVADDAEYVFIGWYTGENGSGRRYTYEDGSAYRSFSDGSVTTLYAFWAKVFDFYLTDYQNETVLAVTKDSMISYVTEVTVPETYSIGGVEYPVTYIANDAFSECPNLEVLNIPDTVIYFNIVDGGYVYGSGPLSLSENINEINVYETGEPSATREILFYSEDGVLFRKTSSGDAELLYYPYGRTDGSYTIPSAVRNENELEYVGGSETPVTRSVSALADAAFRGHAELTYMVIPEYITTLGTYIFYECTSLTGVEFEGDIEKIPEYMFYGCGSLASFDIPSTVTEIGEAAFRACTSLTTFTVPENVTAMGTRVFQGCTSLLNAYFPTSITKIEDYTFYQCSSLRGFEILTTVTEIGGYAFHSCTSLISVVIPSTVTTIGTYAFYGCSSLETITLPEGLTEISEAFLYNCTSLTSVEIPSGVTKIGNYAFCGCESLTEVELPAGVTGIGQRAFMNCYGLKTVTIPENVTTIGTYAYYDCYGLEEIHYDAVAASDLTSSSNDVFYYAGRDGAGITLYIGEKVEKIPDYMFNPYNSDSYSPKIVEIVFAENGALTSIGKYAFRYVTGITSLVLPEGLETVGQNAFYGCYSLMSVTIPSTLTKIDSYAFQNCYKLVEVCDMSGLGISAGGTSFTSNGGLGNYALNVYVPGEGESALTDADGFVFVSVGGENFLLGYLGSDTDIALPDSFDGEPYEMYGYIFYGNKTLTSVTIPEGVTAISEYAFYGCTSLVSVDMPSTLSAIGAYCFYQCSSLKRVDLPDKVTEIPEYAFYSTGIYEAPTKDGVTSIGQYAFYNCDNIEKVVIPDSVTSMGTYAFRQCNRLWSVWIGSGLETIPTGAFYYCRSIVDLTLSEGLVTIDTNAFYNCYALTDITLPTTLESIGGTNAFQNCYNLVEICNLSSLSLTAGATANGRVAYYAKNIYTPADGVSAIIRENGFIFFLDEDDGEYYLLGCDGLAEGDVVLPDYVDGHAYAIYERAFTNNATMTSIVIPDTVTGIGEYAFYTTSALETVVIGSGVKTIPSRAFESSSVVTVIMDGVTEIESDAFSSCSSLRDVSMKSVETIGHNAFDECTSLTEIDLGECLRYIGSEAFYWDQTLRSVTIPSTVEYIGEDAFVDTALYSDKSNWDSGSLYISTCLIEVSSFSGDYIVRDGTTLIASRALYGKSSVTGVTMPDSVLYINDYAFYGCSKMEYINLSENLLAIGEYAFRNCSALAGITLPDGVTEIAANTFYSCTSLTSIVIGAGVTSIGSGAFCSCDALESVFFGGTESEWAAVDINTSNNSAILETATVYFYSEEKPEGSGSFWHWVDGKVTVW